MLPSPRQPSGRPHKSLTRLQVRILSKCLSQGKWLFKVCTHFQEPSIHNQKKSSSILQIYITLIFYVVFISVKSEKRLNSNQRAGI